MVYIYLTSGVHFNNNYLIFARMIQIERYPLDKLIKKSNVTKNDIATALKMSRMGLYKMIKNPDKIRVGQIETLAKLLKVSPSKVFSILLS